MALRTTTSVAPLGSVRVGTVPWRYRGELQLTVLVKAQLRMRNNDRMELIEPAPLVPRDRHARGDPTRSLVAASDLVPYRPRADVWLTGHAYAPLGRQVRASVARLALYRQGIPLLDKTVHVVGDRRARDAEPEPFERMPLVYERAYGGAGFDANPVGVGADDARQWPNVLDPHTSSRPAGFGPISRYWKVRRGQISPELRRAIEQPVAELPDGFDWSYFHAAPEDQRLPFLQGEEWVVLDGMHPAFVRLQTRLPGVTAAARLLPIELSSGEAGDAVALSADTLAIDADAEVCAVTWRGVVPIASEDALGHILVAGAVVEPGQTVEWAAAYGSARELVLDHGGGSISLDRSGVTMVSERPAPEGVLDELRGTIADPATTEDGDAPPASYRRISEEERSALGRSRPRYPRSDELDDESTHVDYAARPSVTEQSALPPVQADRPEQIDPSADQLRARGRIQVPLEAEPEEDLTAPGRIPLAADSDVGEVTAPGRVPFAMDSDFGATVPGRPLPAETEPGQAPPADEELPWLNEMALEPAPETARTPSARERRAGLRSLPPQPLDKAELAAALRRAGASEEEIAAMLSRVDSSHDPGGR